MGASQGPGLIDRQQLEQEVDAIQQLIESIDVGIFGDVTGGDAFTLMLVMLNRIAQDVDVLAPQQVGDGATFVPVGGQGAFAEAEAGSVTALAEGGEVTPTTVSLRGALKRFELGKQFSSGEDIFSNDIEPSLDNVTMRVLVAIDTDTTFSGVIKQGNDEVSNTFNEGNTLGTDNWFAFDLPNIAEDAEVNFRAGADAIGDIAVSEVRASTA